MRFSIEETRWFLPLAALSMAGCFPPDDGIEPPLDRLYFPVNIATDETSQHLFVANSNFDLQFNGGTVQSFDLERLRALIPKPCDADTDCAEGVERCDLDPTPENGGAPVHWCVPTTGPYAGRPCGPFGDKSLGDHLLAPGRCNGVNPHAPQDGSPSLVTDAVGIGAFATDLIYRQAPPDAVAAPRGRLFLPVRGDTTLHWIDVDADGRLECGQSANGGDCDDNHRRGNNSAEENTRGLRLDPEPYGIDATKDGRGIVVSHQVGGRVSLFMNDWARGPTLEFSLPGLPDKVIGVAAVPEPGIVPAQNIPYQPGFLVTFRDSPEIRLVRFYDDAAASPGRPYLASAGSVGIPTNSVGFDSRGIAVDAEERQTCEAKCTGPDADCLAKCASTPLRIYVGNRTPSSLLIGQTVINQSATSSDDLPRFTGSEPMPFGPSRVSVGKIIDRDGKLQTRIFLVCFDTRSIVPFDPATGQAEEAFAVGRGPHAFRPDLQVMPELRALGYVGHFTDSYIGVIDLDQRNFTYGTIVLTLGIPTPPRASK